ncbi:MAG: cell envelope biogenesis protein TolA [Rhodomicrobiaceae bacterium]
MKLGLIISMVFHSALLAFALFSLTTAKALKPNEVKSIPMEIVDISELTKLKAGLKKAPEKKETKKKDQKPIAKEIKEKKKKKKPAPKRAVQPTAEKQEPLPPKKPEAQKKKVEPVKKKIAKKPKPKPKKKAKPKPKPKAKIVKKKRKKKKFNEDKIAALLNKVPDSGPTASKLPDLPGAKKVKGNPRGKHLKMSINEIDAFRRRVSQCWNPPVGGLGAEELSVKLRIKLNKDGTLKGQPRVLNRGASSFQRAAADSAARAVWQCQPYNLPARKYDTWQDMILNFNPRDMLRG